jgi:hypothetical protein
MACKFDATLEPERHGILPFASLGRGGIVEGMNTIGFALRGWLGCCLALALVSSGCESETRDARENGSSPAQQKQGDKPEEAAKPAAAANVKKTLLGKDVWLETQGQQRRVIVAAKVCLRETAGLECLLCRKNTKEYESLLSTEADARIIHLALLAAGASSGSPVKYVEKGNEVVVVPPSGDRIKILIQYEDKGKTVTVSAQQWILNQSTKKDLEGDWVFAGSVLTPNPDDDKKPIYAATAEGGYFCLLNSPAALLDLPLNNPNKAPELRDLVPHTVRIPALETKVSLILELRHEAKKAKSS